MRTWKLTITLAAAALMLLPAAASAAFMHTVAPGESLYSVAAADGLSVSQLAAANGVSPDAQLVAGATVAIPPQGEAVAAAPAYTSTSTSTTPSTAAAPAETAGTSSGGGYLVEPGDTLSGIAARYGVSMSSLAAANGLDPGGLLLSGTRLSLSGAPASSATATTQYVSAPVATTSTASSAGAVPTPEHVAPSTVGSIAAANGVPASLAEAIGYQESGFNNDEVSSTGATGVMQIEPGTWDYIGQHLAGPPPLSPSSATDNIRGGVLLLHSLLDQTGGDPALAAAGYYQGLQSVREHGMYSDTQQYVNNVLALSHRFGG